MEYPVETSVEFHMLLETRLQSTIETEVIFANEIVKTCELKNGETKIVASITERALSDFDITKAQVYNFINLHEDKLNAISGKKWVTFKIFSADFLSIFLDLNFLNTLAMNSIAVTFENHSPG